MKWTLLLVASVAPTHVVNGNGVGVFWPDAEWTSVVNGDQANWMVSKPDETGTTMIDVARVTTCSNAGELAMMLEQYAQDTTNTMTFMPEEEFLGCGLSQEVELLGSFCGSEFREPGTGKCVNLEFEYKWDEAVEFMRMNRRSPMHMVGFHDTAKMQMPRGRDPRDDSRLGNTYETYNPFHRGVPLFEMVDMGDNMDARVDGLEVSFETAHPIRAFFVANNQIPHPNNTNMGDCASDCSCTQQFLADKFSEINVRRRLRRSLQMNNTGCPGGKPEHIQVFVPQTVTAPFSFYFESDPGMMTSQFNPWSTTMVEDELRNTLTQLPSVFKVEVMFFDDEQGRTFELYFEPGSYPNLRVSDSAVSVARLEMGEPPIAGKEEHELLFSLPTSTQPSGSFQLSYDGTMTIPISLNASPMDIEMALMELHRFGSVIVESFFDSMDNTQRIKITYEPEGDVPTPTIVNDFTNSVNSFVNVLKEGYGSCEGNGHIDPIEDLQMMCPVFNETCFPNPNCAKKIESLALYYTLHLQPMNVSNSLFVDMPETDPFYQTIQCAFERRRSEFVMEETMKDPNFPQDSCMAEGNNCMMDPVCRRRMAITVFIEEPDRSIITQDVLANLDQTAIENGEQLYMAVSNCFGFDSNGGGGGGGGYEPPSKLLTIPLEHIPCACGNGKAYIKTREVLEFDDATGMTRKNFETSMKMCFGNYGQYGRIQVQRSEGEVPGEEFMEFKGTTKFQSKRVNLADSLLPSIQQCLLGGGSCTGPSGTFIESMYNEDASTKVTPQDGRCGHMFEATSQFNNETGYLYGACKSFEIRVPAEKLMKGIAKHGRVPNVDVEMLPINMTSNQYMYDALLLLNLESDMEDAVQDAEIAVESQYQALKSSSLIWERPEVNSTVTLENCHETCDCAKLFLQQKWDEAVSMIPASDSLEQHLPFKVEDKHIPCACSPAGENVYQKVTYIVRRETVNGYEEKTVETKIEFCAFSEHLIENDYSINTDVPSDWNWLCNCDLSMRTYEECLTECKVARGEWAWTCDAGTEDGFQVVEPFGQEKIDLENQHCY